MGQEAFIWTASTGIQGLGALSQDRFTSRATGISADGTVIVGVSYSTFSEAFIWDATNGMQGIGSIRGGGRSSTAQAISADGSTVVGVGGSSMGTEAFIWNATTGMQGLGDLPGGSYLSSGWAISADGSVVAGSSRDAYGNSGFVWDATHGMRSLQVMLTTLGVDLTGWQIHMIRAVSADGRTFGGWATNPDGTSEAFLATIPEPGTALLVMCGLSLLSSRKGRTRSSL